MFCDKSATISDICDTFLQLYSLALTDVLKFCLILWLSDICDTFLQLHCLALRDVLQFCLILWLSDICDTFLQLHCLALTDVLQFCLILWLSDICDTFLQLHCLALTDVLQFCLILLPGGKDQKVSVLFNLSRTEDHCQCLLVAHTLVVLLTILTALNLQTGASYCDVNPHLQGISVSLLTSVLSRWQNFCITSSRNLRLTFSNRACNPIAVPRSIQHQHFENPPVVYRRHIVCVYTVLNSPKEALFFLLMFVMWGI